MKGFVIKITGGLVRPPVACATFGWYLEVCFRIYSPYREILPHNDILLIKVIGGALSETGHHSTPFVIYR